MGRGDRPRRSGALPGSAAMLTDAGSRARSSIISSTGGPVHEHGAQLDPAPAAPPRRPIPVESATPAPDPASNPALRRPVRRSRERSGIYGHTPGIRPARCTAFCALFLDFLQELHPDQDDLDHVQDQDDLDSRGSSTTRTTCSPGCRRACQRRRSAGIRRNSGPVPRRDPAASTF